MSETITAGTSEARPSIGIYIYLPNILILILICRTNLITDAHYSQLTAEDFDAVEH